MKGYFKKEEQKKGKKVMCGWKGDMCFNHCCHAPMILAPQKGHFCLPISSFPPTFFLNPDLS